jgi:hypothetical protein
VWHPEKTKAKSTWGFKWWPPTLRSFLPALHVVTTIG